MLKRFKKCVASLLMTVVLLTGAVSASASTGWTNIGTDHWTFGGNWSYQTEGIHTAYTGGYKMVIPAHYVSWKADATPYLEVQLWEDDGAVGDDHVKTWMISPRSYAQTLSITNVDSYDDGTNGGAEFYVKYAGNYTITKSSILVTHYD